MYSFELTDRGKITVAVIVAVLFLIGSIVLAILALAADAPDEPPDEPAANANQETITLPRPTEPPEPPDSGGFPPQYGNDYDDAPAYDDPIYSDLTPEDTTTDDDSAANDDAGIPDSPALSNPTLNLSTGQFSFNFFPQYHSYLDRVTSNLLNTFLNLPNNTPNNTIAIETPVLSADDSELFMSIMTSTLEERNIDSRRITHIVNPEMPQGDYFEVLVYYITQEEK